jgi:hypothetical protein
MSAVVPLVVVVRCLAVALVVHVRLCGAHLFSGFANEAQNRVCVHRVISGVVVGVRFVVRVLPETLWVPQS